MRPSKWDEFMTTKLTLLALLALPCFAAGPTGEKPDQLTLTPNKERFLTMGDKVITITWDKPADDGNPSPDSKFIASLSNPDILSIQGHLIITKQEATDVVKALEILLGPTRRQKEAGYAVNRSPSAQLRYEAELIDERERDLAWARSVLEIWREKIKEAK